MRLQIKSLSFKRSYRLQFSVLLNRPSTDVTHRQNFFDHLEKKITLPAEFWKSVYNQRIFFDWLGKKLGVEELDDWYIKATRKVIQDHGGAPLIGEHHGSWIAALKACYPEHNWISWNSKQKEFRESRQKERIQQWKIKFEAQNKSISDWYQTLLDSMDSELVHIINKEFKGSLHKALSTIFPEIEWYPWKFTQQVVPYGYWQDISTHRQFFDQLGQQVGVQTLDDWYEKLSRNLIIENHGSTILTLYHGSAIEAIQAIYPDHNWIPWKFKFTKKVWNSEDNISSFLSYISEKLCIQTLDDWYRVDWIQLSKLGAESLLKKHKGLYRILKKQYPHHPWDMKKFSKSRKGQRWLVVTLKKIFPEEEIIEDYVHPNATFSITKRPMELDVFIPSRSIAFEYQGQQHFQNIGIFGSTKVYQQRDEEKRSLCASSNIKLIEVPYWWNRNLETLQQMIFDAECS